MLTGSLQPLNSAVNQIRRARVINLSAFSRSPQNTHDLLTADERDELWRAFQTQIHTDHIKHVSGHFRRAVHPSWQEVQPVSELTSAEESWEGSDGPNQRGDSEMMCLFFPSVMTYHFKSLLFITELLITMGNMFSYYM